MKWMTAVRYTFVLLAVLLLNSVNFASHATSMEAMSHEMSGMSHSSSESVSCVSLCRTAILHKEEKIIRVDEEDKDLELLLHAARQPVWFDEKSVNLRLYEAAIELPPKLPAYILYGSFRA